MLVDYKKVNVYQQDGTPVLHDVDFHVDEGEFIYIIGRVGSGKSSLIRSLYGEVEIYECDEATVLGNDMFSIRRKDLQPLRRELGIIFQDFKLLTDRNIHKNLEFVLKATGWKDKTDREQRISEVLRDVKMEGCENKMPHELSGGEQQRIAIARALLNSPKVLLADEPTGNLDPETTDQIMGVFSEIAVTGTAVIIATHNMAILDRFPGTVYQCEGQNFSKYEN